MGWNCPECGRLLSSAAPDAMLGDIDVRLCICTNCGAKYVTVFRPSGRDNYIGLVRVPPAEAHHD